MCTTRLVLPLLALSACTYKEEAFTHKDLYGKVRLPKEVSQFTLADENYVEREIDDARAFGPVYLGVFASVVDDLFPYPHPEIGPVVNATVNGNTYPYGGTTVGRFTWGCYEVLNCKITTGRFEDFADVIDYYANQVQAPLLNEEGEPVTPEEYRERCYEVLDITSDAELDFITSGKESPDNKPDFEDKGDYYEADVTILHSQFEKGVSVWGWIDMPSPANSYRSCNEDDGMWVYHYDEYYQVGTNFTYTLNHPSDYIDEGDWVVSEPAIIDDPEADFVVELGFKYED